MLCGVLQPADDGSGLRRVPKTDRRLEGKVLLAEDNPVNQTVAVAMLKHLGLDVDVAANGVEAVERIGAEDYGVVLMDCQMPELDGFDATRRIREWELEALKRPTPIVALTANALSGDREACLAAGMDDYISKPFTAEELYSVLSLWLTGDAANDAVESDEGEAGAAAG